jgi:hypothetical protein
MGETNIWIIVLVLLIVLVNIFNGVVMFSFVGKAISSTGTVGFCLNGKPRFSTIPNKEIAHNSLFITQINAYDPNNDTLIYSENSQLFDINNKTGIIEFTPNISQVGTHQVLLGVNDNVTGCTYSDETIFTLIINNSAPYINTTIPNMAWEKNVQLILDLDLHFKDAENDTLTYTSLSGPYVNISINNNRSSPNKGITTIIPYNNWIGESYVTFYANDTILNVSSNNVRLYVFEPSTAPPSGGSGGGSGGGSPGSYPEGYIPPDFKGQPPEGYIPPDFRGELPKTYTSPPKYTKGEIPQEYRKFKNFAPELHKDFIPNLFIEYEKRYGPKEQDTNQEFQVGDKLIRKGEIIHGKIIDYGQESTETNSQILTRTEIFRNLDSELVVRNMPRSSSSHSVKMKNVDVVNKIVTFEFKSDPKTVTLKEGETKFVDVDEDSIDDFSVTALEVISESEVSVIVEVLGETSNQTCETQLSCGNWTPEMCQEGGQQRGCVFVSRDCNTIRSVEIKSCCNPKYQCSTWIPRVCPKEGKHSRVCVDINQCGQSIKLPTSQICKPIIEMPSPQASRVILIIFLLILSGLTVLGYIVKKTYFTDPKRPRSRIYLGEDMKKIEKEVQETIKRAKKHAKIK